jgi:diguanylate cyclase (GGDEF)-like protein
LNRSERFKLLGIPGPAALNCRQHPADRTDVQLLSSHALHRPDRFGLDSALLVAYVACLGIVAALLPVGGKVVWGEVGPAVGLQLGVGLLLAVGPRRPSTRSQLIGVCGVLAYLLSAALLRDGAPPTAGYGPLVLLPVVWASLRAGSRELAVAILGVAAVYLVPTAVVGPPQYPVGAWRAGLLFTVLATVIGLALRHLVARVEQLFSQLGELAVTDELTGLPNRRAWQELLEREISAARRTGLVFTVALLDLDRFKDYNDSHGHLAGDQLLLTAAAAWASTLRATDVLARWGGDEFALLLPNCDAQQTEALLDRMRSVCPAAPFSFGLAESDRRYTPEMLLAQADGELYRAKRAGRRNTGTFAREG